MIGIEDPPAASKPVGRKYIIIGVILLVLALVLIPIGTNLPTYISNKLSSEILYKVLITERASNDPHHKTYKAWVDSNNPEATPTTLYAHLFNLTNPNEVLTGEKPNLKELGPYIYRINKKRDSISFSEDIYGQKIVMYNEWKTYTWSDQNSQGGPLPTDQITNVNIIFQIWRAVASSSILFESEFLAHYGPAQSYEPLINTDFDRQFQTKTAEEWLFGWQDSRFDLPGQSGYFPGLLGKNVSDPSQIDYLPSSFYTGETNLGQAFQYHSYELATSITKLDRSRAWGTEFASRIIGTDGTRFPPFVNNSAVQLVYVDEGKRVLPFRSTKTYDLHGLQIDRFEISPEAMLNTSANPDNAMWDMNTTGIFNLSQFKIMPMILSRPHFLGCDERVTSKVAGLHPDPKLHDTFLGVHQTTGVVMHARKALQPSVNIIGPLKLYSLADPWFPDMVTDTFVPFGWMEESGQVSQKDAEELAASLNQAKTLVTLSRYGVPVLALILLALASFMIFLAYPKDGPSRPLFSPAAYGDYSSIQ